MNLLTWFSSCPARTEQHKPYDNLNILRSRINQNQITIFALNERIEELQKKVDENHQIVIDLLTYFRGE